MARIKIVDGVVINFTPEEETQRDAEEQAWNDGDGVRQMEAIRRERNSLLVSTDWTGTSDLTMSSDMTTYRQMLRDIPASNTVYEDVNWGTKPE
jgi:hypothetical protein